MRIKPAKALLALTFCAALFIAGVGAGAFSMAAFKKDYLCNEPIQVKAKTPLEFNGVTVHTGAVVPVRFCEYANRFRLNFYMPKDTFQQFFVSVEAQEQTPRYAGGGINNVITHNK